MWLPDLSPFDGPRYLAIVNALARAIEADEIETGAKLPTHRDLAFKLSVSVHTVSAAYREAERRGLVIGETGRGTFVQAARINGGRETITRRGHGDPIDLSVNRPVCGPLHTRAMKTVFSDLGAGDDFLAMTSCRPIQGLERHRAAASRWLSRHGVDARMDEIVICNGAAHGIMLALAVIANSGDMIACDAHADLGLIHVAKTLNLRLRGLSADAHGILPECFENACKTNRIKALFAVANLNNPTVTIMSRERRQAIAAIARTHGVAIIEDDAYGPLLANAPPPISAFAPELSYYVTTFTKSVMPGLRTGYLVPPADTLGAVLSSLQASSWMATPLPAEIVSRWMGDGTLVKLIAWQRSELGARHKIVKQLLARLDIAAHPGAPHAWLRLSPDQNATELAATLNRHRVAVASSELFCVGRVSESPALRLSLGATRSRARLKDGLSRVGKILQVKSRKSVATG